ncbi:hypothetical protein GBAR_LOCUS11775 [Geodia barretti]|uniref:Uncharacterized protein n=1 Tax=Geodia barretti TaxID=519541 RepID=A0AA35S0F9_GEOBA|nr:hypothetical protein GBAR_LOCUS11775 [Geodia barretti]
MRRKIHQHRPKRLTLGTLCSSRIQRPGNPAQEVWPRVN